MRYIKLRKIVRKQKAKEQSLKNAPLIEGVNVVYFGIDTYNEINKILKNNFKKVERLK